MDRLEDTAVRTDGDREKDQEPADTVAIEDKIVDRELAGSALDGEHEAPGYEAPEHDEAPEYEFPEYDEAPEFEASEYGASEYGAPGDEVPGYQEASGYELPEFEAPGYELPEFEAPEHEVPEYYDASEYEAPEYEAAAEYEAAEEAVGSADAVDGIDEAGADEAPVAVDPEAPRILPRPEHDVSRKRISSGAVKVLYRLKNSGYKAYMCGGAVRDLMLGQKPKDFDVCTDAEPRDLRRLFRNARIIGRRFRLAHVIFRDGVVEVSTFRRAPDPEEQRREPGELLITDDNVFGTPREDAFRRDFTINALFYNVADFSVIDYVGGIDDLEGRLIRVIGDPDLRFREDPVRMMRACEFAGRLGLSIEPRTQEAIERHREELSKAAPARLTEELLQLLKSGTAGASIQWMLELGLLEVLLPEALAMIEAQDRGAGDFRGILPVLDRMRREGRELSDIVLLAAILLPPIMIERFAVETAKRRLMGTAAFRDLVKETVGGFVGRFPIANYKKSLMVQALGGFHRLCDTRWKRAQRLRFATKSYFDDALQLFEILVEATGQGRQALDGWRKAQRQRPTRPAQVEVRRRPPRRRRRRR